MNHTTGSSNEKYNYGYIKSDFDVANAQMDEATVYYIKLMTPGTLGFMAGTALDALNAGTAFIDYDNVDLGQRFNDETLFSAALKNGYLNQAINILKYVEPYLKAKKEDPDNLNHRYSLYNTLNLDDEEVVQKLNALAPYGHKGQFEEKMTTHDFAEARQKAELIRRINALMPLDFPFQQEKGQIGSWFGEFIKNKQFNLAEKYLKPYEGQYADTDILIADLSLNDPQVACALKEMSTKNPKSVFGRIHDSLKKILPTDIYLKHILHKNRYDLEQENKHAGNTAFKAQDSQDDKMPHFVSYKTPPTFPSLLSGLELKNISCATSDVKGDKDNNLEMALFAWGKNQRGGK